MPEAGKHDSAYRSAKRTSRKCPHVQFLLSRFVHRQIQHTANMAPAATGGKKQKKKWSKGKVKDKAQHAVILDKQTSEKLAKDVQSYRLVTVAVLVDRLKINGSLARRALADLEEKGQIRKVVSHNSGNIYTRAVGGGD
nr:40s ribosomal protein s25 [Quercus suber]